jgi:hypothetical protein
LHNPWYAGAYVYGRRRHRKQADGRIRLEPLPHNEWIALIPDNHPGYITWDDYERNERRLKQNEATTRWRQHRGPAREGPALLQGRALCGLCGRRMHINYGSRKGKRVPIYVCVGRGRDFGDPACQRILGTSIDAAVEKLVVETMTPKAVELALSVQQEITARLDEADRLRLRQLQRAQYEADQARHRYMQVDPTHRLVADSLEADWNAKLRALAATKETIEKERSADRLALDNEQRTKLFSMVQRFPEVWHHPQTAQRDRKRILGLIIEDVTLIKNKHITVAVRFRGNATTTLTLPRPLTPQQQRITHEDVRQQIDALLDEYTDAQVAHTLNERGLNTGAGAAFDADAVKWVRFAHKLKTLKQRLLDAGWRTGRTMQSELGISRTALGRLRVQGGIEACICNDAGQWLYRPNDATPAAIEPSTKLSKTAARTAPLREV